MLINKGVGNVARTVYLFNIMQRITSLRQARHFIDSDFGRVSEERIKLRKNISYAIGVTSLMLINKGVGNVARTFYLINVMHRIISLRQARHVNSLRNTRHTANTNVRVDSDLWSVSKEAIKLRKIVRQYNAIQYNTIQYNEIQSRVSKVKLVIATSQTVHDGCMMQLNPASRAA